jgi:hypothetical protein
MGQIEPKNVNVFDAKALGRLGGLKGGRARAEKLSGTRRIEIAKKAALARWGTSNRVQIRDAPWQKPLQLFDSLYQPNNEHGLYN